MKWLTQCAVIIALALASCSANEPRINFGQDECANCRMTISDRHFAAAIVTTKGRALVFDSPECMVSFANKGGSSKIDVAHWYFSDFAKPGAMIDGSSAYFLHSEALNSPMRGNIAAFASQAARSSAMDGLGGEPLDHDTAIKRLGQ